MTSYIDPVTLLPPRFGELFSDRSILVVGSASWVSPNITTQGIKVLLTPRGGGDYTECSLTDDTYPLTSDGDSLWVKVSREEGPQTLTVQTYSAGNAPKPTPDWIPLFVRSGGEVYAFGGFRLAHTMSPLGVSKSSDYEYVVSGSDPRATHTTIQAAINAAINAGADGARILILRGLYTITTPATTGSAFYINGITLTLEGEGTSTIIECNYSTPNPTLIPTTAFAFASGSDTSDTAFGNGSRVLNLSVRGFRRPVVFDVDDFSIRNCVVDIWYYYNDFGSSYFDAAIAGPNTQLSGNNVVTVRKFVTDGSARDPESRIQTHCYILGGEYPAGLNVSTKSEHTNIALPLLKEGADSVFSSNKRTMVGTGLPTIDNIGIGWTGISDGTGGGYLVATDNAGRLSSLAYDTKDIAGSVVLRASNGIFATSNIKLTDLNANFSPSSALTLDSDGFISFTSVSSDNSVFKAIIQRDASGNFEAGRAKLEELSLSSLVEDTAGSGGWVLKVLTPTGGGDAFKVQTKKYTSSDDDLTLVSRNSSGVISAQGLTLTNLSTTTTPTHALVIDGTSVKKAPFDRLQTFENTPDTSPDTYIGMRWAWIPNYLTFHVDGGGGFDVLGVNAALGLYTGNLLARGVVKGDPVSPYFGAARIQVHNNLDLTATNETSVRFKYEPDSGANVYRQDVSTSQTEAGNCFSIIFSNNGDDNTGYITFWHFIQNVTGVPGPQLVIEVKTGNSGERHFFGVPRMYHTSQTEAGVPTNPTTIKNIPAFGFTAAGGDVYYINEFNPT